MRFFGKKIVLFPLFLPQYVKKSTKRDEILRIYAYLWQAYFHNSLKAVSPRKTSVALHFGLHNRFSLNLISLLYSYKTVCQYFCSNFVYKLLIVDHNIPIRSHICEKAAMCLHKWRCFHIYMSCEAGTIHDASRVSPIPHSSAPHPWALAGSGNNPAP